MALLATASLAGCGVLDVEDPTKIQESAMQNTAGAELLRLNALKTLSSMTAEESYRTGLFADEFFFERPSWMAPLSSTEEFLDRRNVPELIRVNGLSYAYGLGPTLRLAVNFALGPVTQYSVAEHVGELYAVRGLSMLSIAENFCPGFPLNDTVDERIVLGAPLTTDEALAIALADFDSAIGLTSDSARILNLARLGRARTLLSLGRYDEAAATVAAVPTDYVYAVEFNGSIGIENPLSRNFWLWQIPLVSVSDREGGNGLDFTSAADPRVQVFENGVSAVDGTTPLFNMGKYPSNDASIVVENGVDARLIEAEAALRADNPQWLQTLKDLRLSSVAPAGLAPLTDSPTTQLDKENLLFRERAFWLFATGRRLTDLRRLVRDYGRAPESVFPSGAYRGGGTFSDGTSLPFNIKGEAAYNPAVTGCLSE